MYKLVKNPRYPDQILRKVDGAMMPMSTDDRDYLDWVAAGNTLEAADPIIPPDYRELRALEYPPVVEQLEAIWAGGQEQAAMKARIDAVKVRHPKG